MAALTEEQRARVERVTPRVRALARALHRRLYHVPVDELESAGFEGLVRAATRYDPDSGIPFARFAHYRIRGAMIDAARANDPAARNHRRALRALETTQSLLEDADRAEQGDAAQTRQLTERVAAARALVERAAAAVALAHSAPAEPDAVADERPDDPEAASIAADTRRTLWSAVHECSDDEQRMVRALYEEGKSMKQLAAAEGVAVSTISRRHAKVLERLASRLRADTS